MLRVVISVGALAFLFWKIGLGETLTVLRHAQVGYLAIAFALFLSSLVVRAFRWRVLLQGLGIKVPFGRLVRLYFFGQFFSSFLPSQFGGDVVRAIELTQDTQSSAAIGTVLVDRMTGLIMLFAMGLVGAAVAGRAHGAVASVAAAGRRRRRAGHRLAVAGRAGAALADGQAAIQDIAQRAGDAGQDLRGRDGLRLDGSVEGLRCLAGVQPVQRDDPLAVWPRGGDAARPGLFLRRHTADVSGWADSVHRRVGGARSNEHGRLLTGRRGCERRRGAGRLDGGRGAVGGAAGWAVVRN